MDHTATFFALPSSPLNGQWCHSAHAWRDLRPGRSGGRVPGLAPRRVSCLAGRPYQMVPTKTGDGALISHRRRRSFPTSTPMISSESLAAQTDVPISAPILIEGVLQSICQGVIFAQVARYWECPLNDTVRMKSYVLTLAGLSL